jgi:hypothetical protein
MSWVYVKSEPGLYTVGFYDPTGKWHSDSDYSDRADARERCAWLNGAQPQHLMVRVARAMENLADAMTVRK